MKKQPFPKNEVDELNRKQMEEEKPIRKELDDREKEIDKTKKATASLAEWHNLFQPK